MYAQLASHKPLSELCTLGIGGPARYFIEVKDIATMQKILRFCRSEKLNYFILGKGSNCLFSDSGFSGVVIANKIDFCHEVAPFRFYVGGGYNFSLLGSQAAKRGMSGLEFAAGIPASVGGAIYMNAGSQGFETAHCLMSVDWIDEEGQLHHFDRDSLSFSYRHSSFQDMKGVICAATFQLKPSTDASLLLRELLDYRLKTQPFSEKSAGCAFRNPPTASAGALIDAAGLKGYRIGGAKVSEMHANFLINVGGAKAQDMVCLIDHVQKTVHQKTGYLLKKEICTIYEN